MSYDIIGDIHGHADRLIELLIALGYERDGDGFAHPDRQVIFLGDFIDRGPQQEQVLDIVMAMVNSGAARSVMGNHEYNALAFHTPHPEEPNQWLRPRNAKNTRQHQAFLNEFGAEERREDLERVLDWFKTLPLWLDLGDLRIVHACWHKESMRTLTPLLGEGNTLTEELLVKASKRGSPEYQAVEVVLKGWEMPMPNGLSYKDKDGHERTSFRTKWWLNGTPTYQRVGMHDVENQLPDNQHIENGCLPGYPKEASPVFLGHYWMRGKPHVLAPNVACVDYSVAKGGKLVAYRWDGEYQLTSQNMHFCSKSKCV